MSLQAAIERNRERWAAKRAGEAPQPTQAGLNAYQIRVADIPTTYEVAIGLRKPVLVGQVLPAKTITIFGTSKEDAKRRHGIC